MKSSENECSRCGTPLSRDDGEQGCRKCLLEIGLQSGTDFSIGDLAETLPHRSHADSSHNTAWISDQRGLQRYRDLHAIHDWSGGTVYRAYHAGLQRLVRLRMLESSAGSDEQQAFLSRAEKLSHLNHPNLPATLEAGVDSGVAYVAEEWLEGTRVGGFQPRSWRERWSEGFFPNDKLIRVMRDAASGLHAMHQTGLTHDRINPDSILIDNNGIVKLIGLGEASESSDTRFAMPVTRASVTADLFRFGATFCFLTTGKLPGELGRELDVEILARRLGQHNLGLRSDVCRLIARCIAHPIVTTASTRRNDSSEEQQISVDNPYESTTIANNHENASAADFIDELNRMMRPVPRRFAWRKRVLSAYLEAVCCFVIAGLTFSAVANRYDNDLEKISISMTTSVYLFPVLYSIVLETTLGWTIVRRVFAVRLFDQSGRPALWWRRLWRSIIKSLLLLFSIILPALFFPLLPDSNYSTIAPLVLLPIITLFLPAMILFLPSRWIPSGWTYYDLIAGVTWGEPTQATRTQLMEPIPNAPRDVRLSSPTNQVDQFELYEPLGRGGMGQVFRGRDTILGRDVAIKLLTGSLIENPFLMERFEREARLAAKVNHPGVAKVFDNGIWNRTPYIVMELVSGRNLSERIKEQGPIPIATAWDYVTQAAEALQAANERGVVHRDIKPANLMITDEGQLKVTDFGVSRRVRLDRDSGMHEITELGATDVGTIVGTPAYMAPEQAMGKDVDCRCDIYALGMTLYHMLAGRPPLEAGSAIELLAQQMSRTPPSLMGTVDHLTLEQWNLIERMIAKNPSDRFGSYQELLEELGRCSPSVDRLAHPAKRIAAQMVQWMAAYLCFTTIIFLNFFTSQQTRLSQYDSTTLFGYLMFGAFTCCTGWVIFFAARNGTTPGKRSLGLRIVRLDGRPIGISRAIVRWVIAYPLVVIFFPRIIYYVIARAPSVSLDRFLMQGLFVLQIVITLVSLVMMCLRPDRRTLHDFAAGTHVIRGER